MMPRPLATPGARRVAGAPRVLLATFVVIAMLALTVLGPLMTYKPEPFTGEGSPLRQICYFAIFPISIMAIRPLLSPRRLAAIPIAIIVALAWCWASIGWAIEPSIAIRRLLLTTIVIWTLFLTVEALGHQRVVRWMRVLLVLTLIANYVTVLAMPKFGIHQVVDLTDPGLVGDWRGMMLQKNFAGAACSFTILAFMLDAKRLSRWLRVVVVIASAYFLIRSGSKTSMGITLVGLIAGWAYTRYDPRYRALIIPLLMILGTVLALLAQIYWEKITAPLSDQGAFTGRTQIWPPLFAYFRDHWLLGSGYGSFWNIGFGESPIYTYSKGWVTHITQGHNGYLDLLVTIGLPGLLLVVAATIVIPIVQLVASRRAERGPGSLALAMIIFAAGHNFTESSIFDRDSIVQTFLILAVALAYNAMRPDARPPLHGSSRRIARRIAIP